MTNGFSSMVAGAGDKGVALLRATFIPVKVLQGDYWNALSSVAIVGRAGEWVHGSCRGNG